MSHASTDARHGAADACAPAPGETEPGQGVDLALRVLGLSALAVMLVTETLPFVIAFWKASTDARPGLVGLLVSQLLAGIALFLPRRCWWSAWPLLGLLLAAMTQFIRHANGFDAITLLIPGYWAYPFVVVALRAPRRTQRVALAVATVLALVTWTKLVVGIDDRTDWADQLWILQPVAELLLFGEAVIAVAQARERSLERDRAARQASTGQDAATEARREAARMLHDHVLHALQALSRAGTTPARMVVDECRLAHRAMTTFHRPAAMMPVEQALIGEGLREDLDVRLGGHSEAVPSAIAQALAGATHEALTNVAKHARVGTAQVQVRSDAGQVEVRVIDRGRGFDPRRRAVDRLGLGSSILQRMDDVGGQAVITSSPGKGTVVSLVWPRPAGEPEPVWQQAPSRLVRQGLLRTAWPGLATGVAMTPLAAQDLSQPLPGALGALLVLLIGIGAARRLTRHAPGVVLGLALLLLALGAWVANLWLVPVDPELDYPLWMGWGATAIVHLVVLSSRLWLAVAATLVWTAAQVVGVMHYGGWGSVWEHSFLVVTGAGDVAVTLLVVVIARRVATQEAEAARRASIVAAATARLQQRTALCEHWSEQVLSEALPLLRRVAEGLDDPSDEQVQALAARIEQGLRDELRLGPGNVGLLRALEHARDDGWMLRTTLGPDSSPADKQAALALLRHLGAPATPGQVATLGSTGGRAAIVALGVTSAQQAAWSAALAGGGGRLDVDPDFVRLVGPPPGALGRTGDHDGHRMVVDDVSALAGDPHSLAG